MIHINTLSFLGKLKKNNNRDWFDKHKDEYLAAKENVDEAVGVLLEELFKFDKELKGLEVKNCVFRIYRDVRFSKDKKPYKTNMGASMSPGGKKSNLSGYYLHIEPGGSFIAGGMWMPAGEDLKKIRQEIDYNGKAFRKILNNKTFKSYYGNLDQTYRLKTTPKGYNADHPEIDLLRLTSFVVWHQFSDSMISSSKFRKEFVNGARIMKPFIDFFRTAVS
ncbi:MAG: DUF2461 domain-containing protein [Bacteroidetes bacterium]|nr:MAG: DUF2461 domain-containing protein [Bacteroidota bacterium]REK04942.1 MAG: DUF2461 domain-containing protein [Bacteroidota bacterium]REK36554.1 MAG: DUF2461 domain-containing protein [Bacteroidota bacterium]REK50920.1 MAG: DUF2461 domain-containing protein [Bacteroidota bacterium]